MFYRNIVHPPLVQLQEMVNAYPLLSEQLGIHQAPAQPVYVTARRVAPTPAPSPVRPSVRYMPSNRSPTPEVEEDDESENPQPESTRPTEQPLPTSLAYNLKREEMNLQGKSSLALTIKVRKYTEVVLNLENVTGHQCTLAINKAHHILRQVNYINYHHANRGHRRRGIWARRNNQSEDRSYRAGSISARDVQSDTPRNMRRKISSDEE